MNDETLDPKLRAAVLAAAQTPSPTRKHVRARSLVIMAVFAGLALGEFVWVGGMRDWGAPRPPSQLAGTVLVLAGLAGLATYLALNRGGHMLGRPAHQLWLSILVTPLAVFTWKVLWSSLYVGGLDDWPDRVGNKCLVLVASMGALLVIGASLVSHAERARPGLGGAATGIAAGATAAVLVDLWCPVGHPLHVFYGHVLPILVLCVFSVLVARVVARVRLRAG